MRFMGKRNENNDAVSSLNNSRVQHKQMDLALRLHCQHNSSECGIKSAFVSLLLNEFLFSLVCHIIDSETKLA